MSLIDITITIFILLGAVILWFAAKNTRKIFQILPENKFRGNWKNLRIFMFVFLAGYLAVICMVIAGKTDLLALLSGVIFFAGALFVFLVVRTGFDSFNELNKTKLNLTKTELINEELSRFAYITSHDLKAPIRAISTLTYFIKDDIAAGDFKQVDEHLDTIHGRINRLEKLIDGILRYSKLGASKPEPIDLQKMVESEFVNYVGYPNVQLKIEGKLPFIYGDKIQLGQVIANIISNAVKYNDKEFCKITVSATESDDYQIITIEDNGPGIAPEYQEKVFEIFQTLNPRDTVESTGIGLSIVKRIIESHRGKIHIESDGKTGSKFVISLPKK